jgi:hypothetical protein
MGNDTAVSSAQTRRSGDMEAFDELATAPLRGNYPGIYQNLLKQRNNVRLPQIEGLAQSQRVELMPVDALQQ